jgi:hypothetical protein
MSRAQREDTHFLSFNDVTALLTFIPEQIHHKKKTHNAIPRCGQVKSVLRHSDVINTWGYVGILARGSCPGSKQRGVTERAQIYF